MEDRLGSGPHGLVQPSLTAEDSTTAESMPRASEQDWDTCGAAPPAEPAERTDLIFQHSRADGPCVLAGEPDAHQQQPQDTGRKRDAPEPAPSGTLGGGWSEGEHRAFLTGLKKLGKGDWRGISRLYVPTRTPTQVASHAQKHFIRQSNSQKRKRRMSLFDIVPERQTPSPPAEAQQPTQRLQRLEELESQHLDEARSNAMPAVPALGPGLDMQAMLHAQAHFMQTASYAAMCAGQSMPGLMSYGAPHPYLMPVQGPPAYLQAAIAQQHMYFLHQHALAAASQQYGASQAPPGLQSSYPPYLLSPPAGHFMQYADTYASQPLAAGLLPPEQAASGLPPGTAATQPCPKSEPEQEYHTSHPAETWQRQQQSQELNTLYRPKASHAKHGSQGIQTAGSVGASGQSSQSAEELLLALRSPVLG